MKKIGVILVSALCIATVIFLMVYNGCTNDDFLSTSLKDCLSIIVIIVISFYLTQKLTDCRKQRDILLKVAESLEALISDPKSYRIDNTMTIENINTRKRDMSNRILTLERFQKEMGISKEIGFVKTKFNEYERLIGDHIDNPDYLKQSEQELRRPLDLICQKLYEIMLNLYK